MTLLLTLDYELFLNDRTGTVENCLEKPVYELQKICDKRGIHYTVFVDAAYLYMLRQLKSTTKELDDDYQRVCNNIKWIHEKGHDIQLHIHPQWYYSTFFDGEWHLDWDHYRLADLGKNDAARYFELSKGILDEIIGEETTIFRAGGYSLTECDYFNLFTHCKIEADSSVLPGVREITNTHKFDYREVPEIPYTFSENVRAPLNNGRFIELPISIGKKVFIPKYIQIKNKYMSFEDNINWGDGGDYPINSITKRIINIISSLTFFKEPKATIDYQSFFFLRDIYKQSKRKGYLTIIGHPKNFSPTSLAYFDSFVVDCLEQGDTIITAKEYCKQLNNR